MLLGAFGLQAQHYSVHSATKGVYTESGGKRSEVTAGMSLKASDILDIPDGGYVEVLNALDKRVYRSVRPGRLSVTKLLVEARHSATDNLGNIGDRMRFGRTASTGGKKVYQEKGMVNRSLAVYDPEGGNIEMDPAALAAAIAAKITADENDTLPDGLTVTAAGADEDPGFSIVNNLDYPVYFNVFSINGEKPQVEISTLGQPGGTYVLLKSQTLAHSQKAPLGNGERTLLVVTPCQFDLDTVIEAVNSALTAPAPAETGAASEKLPVYIRAL